MNIDYLHYHPEHIDTVSRWIYKEFVLTSKSSSTLKQITEFFGSTKISTFPITLIAVENGMCVGTVSLFDNDLKSQKELTPWLASLVVDEDYRNQGIGEILINKAVQVTNGLGFETLYLRTEHTSNYYKRLGWTFVTTTFDEHGQQTDVFMMKC